MDTANITATFGPVQGDRTTLSHSYRTTLETIYRHPLSHNLEWPDVIALFVKLGTVEHKSNNQFVFAIGGEHHLMRKAHSKTLPADDVVEFRHMLTRAGWAPETAKPLSSDTISPAVTTDRPDMLVAMEHHEARIYRLDVSADDPANHTIRPDDPHHYSHQDQSWEGGQNVAEDLAFYARIAEALRCAGRIIVVGHGHGHSNAAHHLTEYLRQHHLNIFQKLGPAVDADLSHLTAPQLLALGRHSLSITAGIGMTG